MDVEWQLVTRRRRVKPRTGLPSQRQASLKTTKTGTSGRGATTNSNHQKAVSDEEAVEPVPEVSAEKQTQIVRRVRAIANVLRGSLLLKDALRVVVQHFAQTAKKSEKKDEVAVPDMPMLVGYGLGSFCASSNAVHQLGFLVALKEALDGRKDGGNTVKGDKTQHCVEIFDPAMNESDAAIVEQFNVNIIKENEHGRRQVNYNTVFFMPHCGKALYENVLSCNWGLAVTKLVIIGNSFSAYGDRILAAKERQELLMVSVLPYLEEFRLSCGVDKTHEDFPRYEAAFNDLSVHIFPPRLLDQALNEDVNLSDKMALLAEA